MKKETIGKVQLAIGIILLIVGIVGVIGVNSFLRPNYLDFSEDSVLDEDIQNQLKEYGSYGDAPTEIKLMTMYNIKVIAAESKSNIRANERILYSTSLILIVLSLLFITQGLANKAEK